MTRFFDKNLFLRSRFVAHSALFIAIASTIWVVEDMLPRPVLWAKIGLSYVPVILALNIGGAKLSIIVSLGKVFVGSLILGRIFSVTFWFSFCGTLCAVLTMILLQSVWGRIISVYGVSVAGSTANGIGQMILASIVIWNPSAVLSIWLPTTLWNICAGIIVGAISSIVAKRVLYN